MASKDGLHSRFHHTPQNPDEPHRGASLVEAHDINGSGDGDLSKPLLSRETSEPYFSGSGSPTSPYVVRREPSRWDSAKFTVVNLACNVLDLLPASVSLKMADDLTSVERTRLNELRDLVVHPFNKDDPTHRAHILELWEACHSGKQLFAPAAEAPPPLPSDFKCERWKDFGFQGVDPSTDFRGAGVFSLRNILYLSATYPQLFGKLVRAEYPFAIAGINVTMILMTQLGLAAVGQTCLATVQNSSANVYSFNQARTKFGKIVVSTADCRAREVIFSEVYCVALSLLHDRWLQSNRNIMEFNGLLKALAKQLETILKCSPDLGSVLSHARLE